MALLCVTALPCQAKQPNVIFFVMDDLNDWVTPLGYDQVTTPNLDRLQRPWVRVVGKKGSQRASARLRAFFTSGLDHGLFARSRHKTGFRMGSSKTRKAYW